MKKYIAPQTIVCNIAPSTMLSGSDLGLYGELGNGIQLVRGTDWDNDDEDEDW